MGLKIRHSLDVQKLLGTAKVNELRNELKTKLEAALLDARQEIIARTQQRSTDMHGNTFAPYSRGYAEYKQKTVGHKNVTLTETGNMLQSIQVTVQAGRKVVGRLFFSGAKAADKARKNRDKRKFFGLSDEQIAQIKKALLGK